MTATALAWTSLAPAAIPAGSFVLNLFWYRRIRLPDEPEPGVEAISVLIPARNEERNLRTTLAAVLANQDAEFEVVVLDDHSTDRTAAIVAEFARQDARVRLERAPALPPGWCGKQHACHVLAQHARHPVLVFMDADVCLAPDALRRMGRFLARSRAALVSGVPRQELGTFSERLLIPLIHFVLLGYLPMFMMRWSRQAGFSAGCGQLFLARAAAYRTAGGHAGIRDTLHDGVRLPRLFRRAGFLTDLVDATDLASCRMYHTNGETWRGLGKNATEGLAAPAVILPMSLLLFGGQVLPFLVLAATVWLKSPASWIALGACALALLPRLIAVQRFRQPAISALLHPLGILALLGIQWLALAKRMLGWPMEWKGRAYTSADARGKAAACGIRLLLTLALAGVMAPAGHAAEVTNLTCHSFELRDQFDVPHQVSFPRTNVVVLTIADQQGNAQVDGWITPLKERYPGGVAILGIAEVGGVPRILRAGLRKKFSKTRAHPVMLDWDESVTPQFRPQKKVANLYVIDPDGKVAAQFHGVAQPEALSRLFTAIDEVRRAQP